MLFPPVPLLCLRLFQPENEPFRLPPLDAPQHPDLMESGDLFADPMRSGLHAPAPPREDFRVRHPQPGIVAVVPRLVPQDLAADLAGQPALLFRLRFQATQFGGFGLQVKAGTLFEKLAEPLHAQKAAFQGVLPTSSF